MSMQFLGTQIGLLIILTQGCADKEDAVYHTSIVLEGIEYFFGQGLQTCQAGATHHGQPMEVVKLGRTELPLELVLDYLGSLKEVYTAEVCADVSQTSKLT
jgi:desumoylating isopeptidase 1